MIIKAINNPVSLCLLGFVYDRKSFVCHINRGMTFSTYK